MAVKKLQQELEQSIQQAITELKDNDNLFCDMIEVLDSYDGFADGFRCYPMAELDELNYGVSLSQFLSEITNDFNLNDYWFYYSIYGIESTDDKVDLYRSKTDEGEVLDNILDKANHLYFFDKDFEELIYTIIELKEKILERK